VSFHYCGDELDSVTLVGAAANCGCEDENDDCCQNEHYYFKVANDQNTEPAEKLQIPSSPIFNAITQTEVAPILASQHTGIYIVRNRPPGKLKYRSHLFIGRISC
jgi:hypothetical protein